MKKLIISVDKTVWMRLWDLRVEEQQIRTQWLLVESHSNSESKLSKLMHSCLALEIKYFNDMFLIFGIKYICYTPL